MCDIENSRKPRDDAADPAEAVPSARREAAEQETVRETAGALPAAGPRVGSYIAYHDVDTPWYVVHVGEVLNIEDDGSVKVWYLWDAAQAGGAGRDAHDTGGRRRSVAR